MIIKYARKGTIAVLAVICIMALFFRPGRRKEETPVIEESSERVILDGGESFMEEETYAGDAGIEEDEGYAITDPVPRYKDGSRDSVAEFVMEYSGYIPFKDGIHFYGEGYFKNPENSIDNRMIDGYGMDSAGYVIWVYRNVTGSCDPAMDDLAQYLTNSCDRITMDTLMAGDIGLYTDERGKKHFGICIENINDHAVFSHCSGLPAPGYPGGHDRVAYLKEMSSEYLQGNRPAPFDEFYRIGGYKE